MRRALRRCAALAVLWCGSVVVAACNGGCPPLEPVSFAMCMSGPRGDPGPRDSFDSSGTCGNGAVEVGEECDGDMCCNADCTKKAGCSTSWEGDLGVCGNGKVEA